MQGTAGQLPLVHSSECTGKGCFQVHVQFDPSNRKEEPTSQETSRY